MARYWLEGGGRYPGEDIPEFCALVEELFTPEEATVYIAIPKGSQLAEAIAREMGREVDEIKPVLEGMASKGFALPFPSTESPITAHGDFHSLT